MDNINILDVVTDVALSEIIVNKDIDNEVRASAADLIRGGYLTADVLAVTKDSGVALVLVPNGEREITSFINKAKVPLSAGAEKRLIARNIAKGYASAEHPFIKSNNEFAGQYACLVCGSTTEVSTCEPVAKDFGPFMFAPTPAPVASPDMSDGAVQVELDPETIAAILQAVQQTPDGESDSSSSSSDSSDSSSSSSSSSSNPPSAVSL